MESDASTLRPARRRHSAAFKAQILQACGEPGASLSGIAIAHDLNPNMVQRWRREARRGELTLPNASAFIPVVTPSEPVTARHQDVLTRLPTQPNRRIAELLPHRWQPA